MNVARRLLIALLVTMMLLGSLVMPRAAMANEKGKRNTSIVLGAGAIGAFVTHHTVPGLLLGGAAAYSYSRYHHEHVMNKRARRGY